MKQSSGWDKILFLGICCVYVTAITVCISTLLPQNPDLPSMADTEYKAVKVKAEKPGKNLPPISQAADGREVLTETPEKDESEIENKSEQVFEYGQEYLTSVRGKKAEAIFHSLIIKAARKHEVDPALIKSIIWAESSFNPMAVSNKGAEGLMQLMPQTAESLGVKDSLNPKSNIEGGVRYFKQLLVRFKGDEKLALAAYNAGSRRVLQYNGVPPFQATQYYIKKVFKYYDGYKQFESSEVDQI